MHKARGLLEQLVQDESVTEKEYKENLRKYQIQLLGFQRKLMASRKSMIVVFEGPDAAGKGGAIKRMTEKLDPRSIRVYSVDQTDRGRKPAPLPLEILDEDPGARGTRHI